MTTKPAILSVTPRDAKVGDHACFIRWSPVHGRMFYSKPLTVKKVGKQQVVLSDDSKWTHRGDEYTSNESKFSSNRRRLHLILDLPGYEQMIADQASHFAEQQRRGSLLNALHELVTRRDVLAGVPTENIAEAVKLLKADNNSVAASARRDG